jgi:DNA-binding MarR family transcriptional regulator
MAQPPLKAGKKDDSPDGFDETLLGVLNVVERDSQISQRLISRELGVALGLANAYLKRCVRKGFIKISQVPKRRYAYYLTPQGFAEKARLTGEYLSVSLSFFRTAREQMSELLAGCAADGYHRVALAGAPTSPRSRGYAPSIIRSRSSAWSTRRRPGRAFTGLPCSHR